MSGSVLARIFLLLVTLVYGAVPSAAEAELCDAPCRSAQRAALLQLFSATNPSGWNNSDGWGGSQAASVPDLPAHCGWFGVACCIDGELDLRFFPSTVVVNCSASAGVTAILLYRNNLTGPITGVNWAAFATSLRYLDLAGNALTGLLPQSIRILDELEYLRLEHNRLTGTIPVEYAAMGQLSTFILSANLLSGQLPSFQNLVNLAVFKASDNHLNGTIPSDWTSSTRLQVFSLEYNQLSGTIPPPAPANLLAPFHAGLQIKLRNNSLVGSLPQQLANLPIGLLDVGSNNITGNLSILENMPLATEFRFDGNALTGRVPSISPNVQVFDVQDNTLSGSVPTIRGTALVEMRLSLNAGLTGPFPADCFVPYLLFFRIHGTGLRQSLPSQQNSLGENLPPSLQFDRTSGLVSSQDVENLECYGVVANPKYFFNLKIALVDSSYFDYQFCKCRPGFNFKRVNITGQCVRAHHVNVGILVPAVVFGILALGLLLVISWLVLRHQLLPAAAAHHKMKGPPGDGKPATLVLTDVEASTELWEWDRVIMLEAISIHDRIMRSQLKQYYGYEVSTEGDAFLLVFHDPIDAVAYTIATQQALLSAPWPFKLEEHLKSCVRLRNPLAMQGTENANVGKPQAGRSARQPSEHLTDADMTSDRASEWLSFGQIDPKDILHWGLNVRMAVATGTAENTKINAVSKRREYHGQLKQWVEALSDVPHGGQIIVDSATFSGINMHLTDILKAVPAYPDYQQMNHYRKESPGYISQMEQEAPMTPLPVASNPNMRLSSALPGLDDTSNVILSLLGPTHRHDLTIVGPGHQDDDTVSTSTGGGTARTTVDFAAFNASSANYQACFHEDAFDIKHRFSFKAFLETLNYGDHRSTLKSLRHCGRKHCQQLITTGQRIARKFGLTGTRTSAAGSSGDGIMVIDMGTHVLPRIQGAHLLIQIAVPGLEERARFLPALRSIPVSPGYLDAPGALDSPLVNPSYERLPMQPVTLVFCSIDGLAAMKDTNAMAAELAVMLYQDYVRRWLLKMSGYECQQADGGFMLAFASPLNAIHFCLVVQDAMLQGMWSREVLALPNCGAASGANNEILWYGPRVRMGLYEGEPTRVVPHTTSGRADYFGPLVNRAARFCYGAAHGGQIMMPLPLAQRIVKEWTGEDIDLKEDQPEVRIFYAAQNLEPGNVQHSQRSVIGTMDAQAPTAWRRPVDPRRDLASEGKAHSGDLDWELDITRRKSAAGRRKSSVHTSCELPEAIGRDGIIQISSDDLEPGASKAQAHAPRPAGSSRFIAMPQPERARSARGIALSSKVAGVSVPAQSSAAHASAPSAPPGKLLDLITSMHATLPEAAAPDMDNSPPSSPREALLPPETPPEKPAKRRRSKLRSFSAASYLSGSTPIYTALPTHQPGPPRKIPSIRRSQSLDLGNHGHQIESSTLRRALTPHGHEALGNSSSNRSSPSPSEAKHPRGRRIGSSPNSRRISRTRLSGTSEVSRGNADSDLPPLFEVEVHHHGLFHFKGLAELQNVVQMNSVQLAGRVFPPHLPTRKSKMVAPARGLQCVITIQ